MSINLDMKFLIVDDNQAVRQIVADILRSVKFHNFIFAEDGKIAKKKFYNETVDCIILDWDMPVMNGLEFLDAIKGSDGPGEHEDIPVLMLTAHCTKDDVIAAVQHGATNYVVKPFTPDTLIKKLEIILGEKIL
ncbi:response regulator [uncultured Pseudodesulfovibrio sp.]|uniref:response regulator n=1 Tax=uncultured Pseudodesulfovibrio sp. TaxID=2035858 RepID=UPI0029C60CF8|nr:response regulator [uncultured Pseudodesulfovibrio sp.]